MRDGKQPRELFEMLNPAEKIAKWSQGNFKLVGNSVFYKDTEVTGKFAERIVNLINADIPVQFLMNFFERLELNPSFNSRKQLFAFLDVNSIAITQNGTFLCYKAVRNNWTDKHTGTIPNCIGQVVTMKRELIDDNPDVGCSKGLHAGGLEYVKGFACGYGTAGGDRIIIVEIDPADVVSVPHECAYGKLRTCRYKVLMEFRGELPGYVSDENIENQTYEEDNIDDDWNDDDEPGIEEVELDLEDVRELVIVDRATGKRIRVDVN